MSLKICLVLFLLFKAAKSKVEEDNCRGTSKCVPLPSCVPYMNLIVNLEKPLQPSVVSFLRAQECGFKNGYPNVCCKLLPSQLRVIKHIGTKTPTGPEILHIPLPTRHISSLFDLEEDEETPTSKPPSTFKISPKFKGVALSKTMTTLNAGVNPAPATKTTEYSLNIKPTHSSSTLSEEELKWKSYQLNLGFSEYLDTIPNFDLFRKRRHGKFADVQVEVEIR